MNIAQAKRIPMERILEVRTEAKRAHQKGSDIWYYSPFRVENTPSFKLNTSMNTWKDFGAVEGLSGGTTIDFAIAYDPNVNDAKQALAWLRNSSLAPSADIKTVPRAPQKPKAPVFKLEAVRDLHNRALLNYIEERGIFPGIAKQECKQIHYKHIERDKTYFAIGFKNREGGYELRNPYYKGCPWSKSFSFIRCQDNIEPNGHVMIFEGFMDYLSWLTLEEKYHAPCPVMVLNGIENRYAACEYLKQNEEYGETYTEYELWLDNDKGGQITTNFFREQFADSKDYRASYHGHADLNAMLISMNKTNVHRKLG